MKPLFLFLLILLLLVPVTAANINVTVSSLGDSYVLWQWNPGYNLTRIIVDSEEICGYETTNNSLIRSGLDPDSIHTINVTDGANYGDNITRTLLSQGTVTVSEPSGSGNLMFILAIGVAILALFVAAYATRNK